jgi:Tol biopolymer transport system component/tRNA A-37 threonylcarbamoyl transferase component Bud32
MIEMIGRRVGPYEVLAAIGAGGMGEVYRARDTKLNRDVALKILPALFADDPERLARFEREAQLLAALNHPHIAGIYGSEESGSIHALVLEFVDGPTLADRIAQGAVPMEEALPIALQIADALEAAHAQGIVHRDLKPANIKLRPDGAVKVLDFGLAKALDPTAADARAMSPSISPTITAATQLGMILGTAAYMSPEQAKGKPVDKRTDNWAFGCVLYEMLTGQRAFPGDDITEVIAFVITKEPDWSALPRTTPPALHRVLRRCLQKDRKQRLADIADARLDLTEARAESSEPNAAPSAQRRVGWRAIVPWLVAASALIALGVVAGPWRGPAPGGSPPVTRFALPLQEGQRVALTGRTIVAISNDGTMAAYVAASQIYLRRFSDFDLVRVFGTDAGSASSSPAFAPDGRSLAFHSPAAGAVMRVELSGGAPVRGCAIEPPLGMTWDSTGILVGQGLKGVVRCPATGGTAETLATVNEGEEAHGPQLLPDGDTLIFTIAKRADGVARWDKANIVVHSLRSGERKTIIAGGSDGRYVPSGHLLYALGGIVFAVAFDAERHEVNGGPVPVIEGVRRALAGTTGIAQFATSNGGNLVYLPGPAAATTFERALAIADRAGTVTPLKVPQGPYAHVRASRDGSHLVIGTDDGKDASVSVYRLDGTRSMQRLAGQHQNRFPIWSPDGQSLAFQSNREGDLAIFSQRSDGTGAAERLTKPARGEAHIPESWSPDGAHMLFATARDGRYSLSILSIRDKSIAPVLGIDSEESIGAVFSPNGRWFTYRIGSRGGARTVTRGVYVQPFPPTGSMYAAPQVSLDFHPLWSPGGNEIIFVPTAASGQLAAIAFNAEQTVTFGVPVMIPARVTASRTSGQERAHDILPDGRFVGLLQPETDVSRSSNTEIRVVLNWFEELKQRVSASQVKP